MLNYTLLNKKPLIRLGNETGIDLLHKTIDTENVLEGNFIYVNEYYVARPDLISLAIYQSDEYADILCKINGISNPFELNEGMVIYTPSIETIESAIQTDYPEKTSRINNKTSISVTNKIGAQKEENEKRGSWEQVVGDTNYIIDKSLGIVFY